MTYTFDCIAVHSRPVGHLVLPLPSAIAFASSTFIVVFKHFNQPSRSAVII